MSTELRTGANVEINTSKTPSRASTVATVFLLASAVGMTTGLIEAGVWAYRRHVLGRLIFQGQHYYWLAPLTDLILLLASAVIVSVGILFVPQRFRSRLAAFSFLFLGAMGLRGIIPRVHGVAWLLLSAGAAYALSELLQLKSDSAKLRLRRAVIVGLILCAGLTGYGLLHERRVEHQAFASIPAAANDSPNLLWIVMDTVPNKRMSLFGYPPPTTPRLEEFAKTGVSFPRCFSTSPWTLPSHGSMFTGMMPYDQTSAWEYPLDDSHPTIAEYLRDHGYATAGFGANTYYLSTEFGLARGFCRFREPRKLLLQAIKSSQLAQSLAKRTILPVFAGRVVGQKTAADINRECLNWLDQRPSDHPFFAFINYIDTHSPYMPPPEFSAKFGSPKPRTPILDMHLLDDSDAHEQLQLMIQLYEACLAYEDDQLGRLLDDMRARGLLENTVVVITADHGEQLGEQHNVIGHGNSLYLPQIHVPLILSCPTKLPTNQQVDELVSLADLPATVTDLLALSGPHPFPGSSLVPLMNGNETQAIHTEVGAVVHPKPWGRAEGLDKVAPIHKGEMRSAISSQYHYILNGDGAEELYDYANDPEEIRNLVDQADVAEQLERLRAFVKPWPSPSNGNHKAALTAQSRAK